MAVKTGKQQSSKQAGFAVGRIRGFLSESLAELKKVSSPSWAETVQATTVTLFIMLFVAVCLLVMDYFFSSLMKAIIPG